MIIAQLTDTHVLAPGRLAYGKVPTNAMLEAAVAHVASLRPRPAITLVTGDLCDGGREEEYAELRRILAGLAMPTYLIPGNHDNRQALAHAFPDHAYLPQDGGFLHYVIEEHPLRLIALDTVVPGASGGEICGERLEWLRRQLESGPKRPTLLFMHHPPFATGVRHMDAIGLEGAAALGALVERHPEIERILCGHLHRPIQMRWHGTLVSTAPSTAHQVVLDLNPDGPADFNLEPPACQLHLWDEAQGLVSHTSYIGRFAGPYPFAAD